MAVVCHAGLDPASSVLAFVFSAYRETALETLYSGAEAGAAEQGQTVG